MGDMRIYIPNCVWHVSDMSAYVLPKCLFKSVSANFGHANSICPIFREGHAEFLYEFDPCMHVYVFKIIASRGGDHEG